MSPHLYILARLLHLANRSNLIIKGEEFYAIKDRILAKYAHTTGYDLQLFNGKKCWACGGTGIYHGLYWESGEYWEDTCNRCNKGWYKDRLWVLLEVKQFGKYKFHKPIRRYYGERPDVQWQLDYPVSEKPIEGYIEHVPARYSDAALRILFLFYNPKYWWKDRKRWLGIRFRTFLRKFHKRKERCQPGYIDDLPF